MVQFVSSPVTIGSDGFRKSGILVASLQKIRYDEKERLIYFPLLSREANDISRLPCVENWYKSYVKFMVIVWSAGHS